MEVTLESIAPNATITKWYREQMENMMDDMRASIIQEVVKPMRSQLAMDGIADWLGHVIDSVVSKWQGMLNNLSKEVANELVKKSKTHYDKRLLGILKRRGFTVNFTNTDYVNEQAQIAIGENTALIRSIGNEYLDKVRSAVWRSVKGGYDVESLIKQLRQIDGVTDRRAKNIAKDQVAKANQAFEDARARELGITKAIWLHSSASKVPRPDHVKATGTVYELEKGCYISGEWIKPAISKINCHCRKKLIIELPNNQNQ